MCRLRSIRETADFFKKMDPDTQLTEKTIRTMIAEGTIPTFKTGSKHLINIDMLLDMFGSPCNVADKINSVGSDIVVNK